MDTTPQFDGIRAKLGLNTAAALHNNVQVNHRKLKFICSGCGNEYANPRDLLDCVKEHLGGEA